VEFVAFIELNMECDGEDGLMPLKEVWVEPSRDLLGTEWTEWLLVAGSVPATALVYDDFGHASTWRDIPLTKPLRCPNPQCGISVGVGLDALACPQCAGLVHRPPSSGLGWSRESAVECELKMIADMHTLKYWPGRKEELVWAAKDPDWVYDQTLEEAEEQDMQDEDEATTNNHRNSLIPCRTFPPLDLSIFSMVPVEQSVRWGAVESLVELDGDGGAARTADRLNYPALHTSFLESPLSLTQRTKQTKNVTGQREIGLVNHAHLGMNTKLVEPVCNGQPIAVTDEYLACAFAHPK